MAKFSIVNCHENLKYIYTPLNILFVLLLVNNFQYLYKPRSKLLAIVSAKIPSEIDIRKRPYLSQMADNQKNKGALLSRILKVGESKVPSDFRFVAYWPRYGCF